MVARSPYMHVHPGWESSASHRQGADEVWTHAGVYGCTPPATAGAPPLTPLMPPMPGPDSTEAAAEEVAVAAARSTAVAEL
mmetsp:Transcript_30257/g.97701  ORF Transcript_30257/g.97701 Transcript_30257/m.97701 type:complete len:81 (+) Transcript_30257:586-828(+)